jgi:hypothetical protein
MVQKNYIYTKFTSWFIKYCKTNPYVDGRFY